MKDHLAVILLLILMPLTACSTPNEPDRNTTTIFGIQAWIDAPLSNAVLPLEPYTLIFHGANEEGVDEFEIHVNGLREAVVPATESLSPQTGNTALYYGEYSWSPPAPGTYLLTVYAGTQGELSSPAQVQVVVGEELDGLPVIEIETPIVSLEPTLTLTPTFTPTPEPEPCIFTALVGLNCRKGPGVIYDYVDGFVKDQSAPVVAASTTGYHWYVVGPNTGLVCAVPNDPRYGYTTGLCEDQPQFTPLPEPTLTPTIQSRSAPTEEADGCTVRQAGGAIICVSPCPRNAAPGEPCTP